MPQLYCHDTTLLEVFAFLTSTLLVLSTSAKASPRFAFLDAVINGICKKTENRSKAPEKNISS